MASSEEYLAKRNDCELQLYVYKTLGKYARTYVLDRFTREIPIYTPNSDGIRTHVGIYLTKGMEVNSRGNVCKEQYSVILMSKLIRCSQPYADSTLDGIDSYAWVSAMENILESNGETDRQLAFLKWASQYYSGLDPDLPSPPPPLLD